MVKGLTLPEGLACTFEDAVCIARAHAFDGARDALKRQSRLDQEMDMIGHDDVREKGVLAQFVSAPENAKLHAARYLRILEP